MKWHQDGLVSTKTYIRSGPLKDEGSTPGGSMNFFLSYRQHTNGLLGPIQPPIKLILEIIFWG
jgi:hypothetical protein